MEPGIEIEFELREGHESGNFVAQAIGNLAAFHVASERKEHLLWQVIRREGPGPARYRLLVRHPDRRLDIGLRHDIHREMDRLQELSREQLHRVLDEATTHGLVVVPIRHVHEAPDLWQDDFWNHLG